MAALKLEQIGKRYGAVQVIPDLSLDVAPGEFIVFLGPSGCGKTTLLRMIAGLEEVSAGRILIGGQDVTHAAPGLRQLGQRPSAVLAHAAGPVALGVAGSNPHSDQLPS